MGTVLNYDQLRAVLHSREVAADMQRKKGPFALITSPTGGLDRVSIRSLNKFQAGHFGTPRRKDYGRKMTGKAIENPRYSGSETGVVAYKL